MKLAVKFPVNIFHCGQQQLASKTKIVSVDLKLILINFAYLTPFKLLHFKVVIYFQFHRMMFNMQNLFSF